MLEGICIFVSLKETILDYLNHCFPASVSYSELANQFSIDCQTVEQVIKEIVSDNMPVIVQSQFVRLINPILSRSAINSRLTTSFVGRATLMHQSVPSTNDWIKHQVKDLKEGTLVLAHQQYSGKGRLGRNWSSPAGKTVSMSLLLKPADQLLDYSLLTQLAAAALVSALEIYCEAKIKWPNDIIVQNKKVAGILTEAEYSGSFLEGIIIGIGINTNLEETDFSEELKLKAGSLKVVRGTVDPNLIIARFAEKFEQLYTEWLTTHQSNHFLDSCRSHSALIGHTFWIIDTHSADQNHRKALIQTINERGGLVVKYLDNSETEVLTSTHYSIRGEHGYL